MEELTYEEKFIIEKLKEHEGKIKYDKLIKVCENKFWGMRLILKKLKEKGIVDYEGTIAGLSEEITLIKGL